MKNKPLISAELEEIFEKKAAVFICENALMRQLYWCQKTQKQLTDPKEFENWKQKEKIIREHISLLNEEPISETLKKIKDATLEETQTTEKTAVYRLRTAWEFYYQAEKDDRLHNDTRYKKLKENEDKLTESEQIELQKIEKELIDTAMSNAKGIDFTQPVSIVNWDKPCAQYNPMDRPGRYFFPLEQSITQPSKLGILNINIWTILSALKNQGSPIRPLTPYQPLKPLLALRSVASATIDHWSLSHPGDKRQVVTEGGADQLFIAFPRRTDPKETKKMFDTKMKVLPRSVLEEALYKNLNPEDPWNDLESRVKHSAGQKIGNIMVDYRDKRRKKSIQNFPQIEMASELRDSIATQIDTIDLALSLAAEQEYNFRNQIIKNQGEEAYNILLSRLENNTANQQLSSDQ
ncbi:MAG: hypothetical protein JO131_08045, partial [Gammaproteobacteria bacterium]|nr:hypothetical protein [Gammaproteobacteria bacterium]